MPSFMADLRVPTRAAVAGKVYSFAPHGNSLDLGGNVMATTNSRAPLAVAPRDFLLLCAAASGAPLASLAPRSAFAAEPKRGGTLRVGFYIEAATMDPHFSGSKIDRQVYHNIYEPLVTLDVKLGIKPGLAEPWPHAERRPGLFQRHRG